MPFIRPIVEIYQEFINVTVAPAVPDLNCCLVGPCYHIEDYPANIATNYVAEFIKSGQTKDAPCSSTGSSAGRPDAGTTFVTLSSPPNHTAGAILESSSVDVVFDQAYIELNFGIDGVLADNDYNFTSVTGDFIAKKVAVGDRIVLTTSTGAVTIVKYVKAIISATALELTSTKKTTELIGNTSIRWRVEHILTSQHIDSSLYVVVAGNAISINTTASSILLAYESLTWKVNYAKIYIGYRELRTDLQDVKTIADSTGIVALLGIVDERNPLAVGAQTAFANTNTPLQVFGVGEDTLTGQTNAKDRMTSRSDIYVVVPLTDSLSGVDWVSVHSMWKTHCVAYADPAKSKFRIVIGSYDLLPTEKSSAPPSIVGYTEALVTDPIDVLVDPDVATNFVTNGIDSTHLLDIARSASIQTLTTWGGGCGQTPFKTAYTGNTLLGAIGEKRLRLAAATTAVAAQVGDYVVREALVAGEGATPRVTVLAGLAEGWDVVFVLNIVAYTPCVPTDIGKTVVGNVTADSGTLVSYDNVTRTWHVQPDAASDTFATDTTLSITTGTGAGTIVSVEMSGYNITGSAATFSDVAVNDIAALSDASTGVNNDGYRVKYVSVDGSSITLDLKVIDKTGITVKVRTYRPSDVGGFITTGCSLVATTRRITKAAGFTGAAIGDIALVLRSDHATQTVGNVGTWVVTAVDVAGGYVVLGGVGTLVVDAGAAINVVIYHTLASRGGASLTTRRRLSRLRDDTAHFLTTVLPGELIEIPYPVVTTPTLWDTAKTSWPIDSVDSDEYLTADLDTLEELAPKAFIAGYAGDCHYRIAITLDRAAQVAELNTITASLSNMRCVMVWPNEVLLPTEILNNLTGVRNNQTGQYLACAVGGMVAGLPSNQGFTFIGIGGIAQIFNSNFYFTDDQLTDLRNAGWYVFVQDSESSLPYTIHEVTTDVSAYEFGELMNVKNFDYVSYAYKAVLQEFLGKYNILPETIITIVGSLNNQTNFLRARSFAKIGAPLLNGVIGLIEQTEADRLDIYMEVDLPTVLNKIGLHLLG